MEVGQQALVTIGPAYNEDSTRSTALTILDFAVNLWSPSKELVYTKVEGGAEPEDPDIVVEVSHLGNGLYEARFISDTEGKWTLEVYCTAAGIPSALQDFWIDPAGTGALPVPTTNADYLERVRSLVQDRCLPPAISLAATATSGSLAAGILNIRVSSLTEYGETSPCDRVSLTVAEDDAVTVSITRVAQASGYRVYASMGSNPETLQGEVAVSQVAITTYSVEVVASGSAMPSFNTGSIHLSTESYVRAIAAAVQNDYSPINPVEATHEEMLTRNTKVYTLPTDWEDGFSVLRQFQYPETDFPPEYLDWGDDFHLKDGEWYFDSINPTNGEVAKLYFTTRHIVDESTNTVPETHFELVCQLAAARVCEEIAVKYSHLSNSSIGADSVDYRMRSDDFRKNAKNFREAAFKALGAPAGIKAMSSTVVWGFYPNHGTILVT